MNRSAPSGGKRALRQILSRSPDRSWPDGVLHHGFRLLLLFGVAGLLTGLFPPDARFSTLRFEAGTVAERDIIAEIPFSVPKAADELGRQRDEAALSVPPIFDHRPDAVDSMEVRLTALFDAADSAAASLEPVGDLVRVLGSVGIVVPPAQARLLTEESMRDEIREAALDAVRRMERRGVLDTSQPQLFAAGRITVRREGGDEVQLPRDSVATQREFFNEAVALLPPSASTAEEDLLRLILIQFQQPTHLLDAESTEADREAARRAVPVSRGSVLRGEAIVRANQRITVEDVERLAAYYDQLHGQGALEGRLRSGPVVGGFVLNSLLLAIFGLLLYFYRPEVYTSLRWLLLQVGLIVAYFLVAALIARHGLPSQLLPITFVSLVLAVLWDSRMALVLALVLAALTGAQPPFTEFGVLLTTLVGGSAAALSVRAVRRRAQTWIFVALIGSAYALILLALTLVLGTEWSALPPQIGWAVGNGTVSAILAMGFIPIFEWFTGITTDQTLLEWADPNRPLLKRLSLEAPGTYAHSINVANLSEAAANAIGANGLLCRVGVYYHDIGKVLKPQFFVENQPGDRNLHDYLKPATSAGIVREHVTEGLRLARDAKLPQLLVDFIPEHHGTLLIQYFWDRAREEAGEEADALDEKDFRYPGPRPRSKETAIVMLADAVESAARVLRDPSPERMRELIDGLVAMRIKQGQLDEAPLTLGEISRIKEQFAKVLAGMYHHRVDYPSTRHLTDPSAAQGGAPPADGTPPADEVALPGGDAPARGDAPSGRDAPAPEGSGEGPGEAAAETLRRTPPPAPASRSPRRDPGSSPAQPSLPLEEGSGSGSLAATDPDRRPEDLAGGTEGRIVPRNLFSRRKAE